MNTTDPISDYLTRLRNAIRARHKRLDVPASNLKRAITGILVQEKYIGGYTEITDNKQGIIRITLKTSDGANAITGLKRISKPGLRMYANAREIPRVMNGLGIAIISTSKGVMTGNDARAQGVGGEVLAEIW
ncbi:MAG: 30S ribosomal protein S8 [Ignavibacteriae bacterium]|nr:30S ribosomal protein S8 [Ignavibacteria bacterium]MBI3364472.1 30S ribosomal protein S8 [Ignavibacteriota bacterium]